MNASPAWTTRPCTSCPIAWPGCSGATWRSTTPASTRCVCPPTSRPAGSSGLPPRSPAPPTVTGGSATCPRRGSTRWTTWSRSVRSTSTSPNGPPRIRPGGARGSRRARSGRWNRPCSARSVRTVSRGWISGPGNGCRCCRCSSPHSPTPSPPPPTGCTQPTPLLPVSCSPSPGRACAAHARPTPRSAKPGPRTPTAANDAT
jgi:hypothetical protein